MPWWSWVLIWVSLLACTLLVLVLGGVHIVRKGLALMREAGEALGQLSPAIRVADGTAAEERADAGGRADDGGALSAAPAPGSAVFAEPAAMRREYAEGRARRREARRERRVERRRLRGQPQSLRDLGLI